MRNSNETNKNIEQRRGKLNLKEKIKGKMDKKELLRELKEKFSNSKEELNFKISFEEAEKEWFLEDMVLSKGFVSNRFSKQMISWVLDNLSNWIELFHAWINPPPQNLIISNESKILEKELKEASSIISRIMYLIRKNKRISFEKDKKEGEFVDELMEFQIKEFNPFAKKYFKKLEQAWKEDK